MILANLASISFFSDNSRKTHATLLVLVAQRALGSSESPGVVMGRRPGQSMCSISLVTVIGSEMDTWLRLGQWNTSWDFCWNHGEREISMVKRLHYWEGESLELLWAILSPQWKLTKPREIQKMEKQIPAGIIIAPRSSCAWCQRSPWIFLLYELICFLCGLRH